MVVHYRTAGLRSRRFLRPDALVFCRATCYEINNAALCAASRAAGAMIGRREDEMEEQAKDVVVCVLTDQTEAYQNNIDKFGFSTRYVSDVDELLDILGREAACNGLILDSTTVMRTGQGRRDLLFSYAANIPFLRSYLDKTGKFVHFSEEIEVFKKHLTKHKPLHVRQHARASVRLNAEMSKRADPAMANCVKANILDISSGGCYVYTMDVDAFREHVNLRILELGNRRPILCKVRWRRAWGLPHSLPGFGLMFVDIDEEQRREIEDGFVAKFVE